MKRIDPFIIYPHALSEIAVTIAGELPLQDLDLEENDRTSFPNPFTYRLELSLVSGGILVRGELSAVVRCRCDRCLTYYDLPLDVPDVCHFFKNGDVDQIDLTDDIREDILLGFPQRSVCRDDCNGLCSQCGQNLNVRDCGCRPEAEPGTLWQALDQIKMPEEES